MSSIVVESSEPSTAFRQGSGALHRPFGKIRRGLRRCVAGSETQARTRPLVFAAGLVTLLFAAVIWAMPPGFQTNDDAIMCMIAAGQGIALAPDEHLVFTNAVIGQILKRLYTEYPTFHWYGWYLVATQWMATIGILYCLLRPRYTRLSMLGFGAYFLTAGIYFLVNIQFTATGTLAGIVGGLMLVQILRHPWDSRLEQAVLASCSVMLLVWGGLIRSDVFALTLFIVCPVLIATYWASSASRRAAAAVGLCLASAGGLMFLAGRYHEGCYSDHDWQNFYQYNALRVKFNDEQWVDYLPETKHVFDQVGWSKNDYAIMQGWYYDDPQYDQEKLSTILNSYSWALERDLLKTLRMVLKDMFRKTAFVALLFVMAGLLLFQNPRQRKFWPCAMAFLSAWGILLAITLFRKAPPERVYMPVAVFPWLVLLYTLSPGWRSSPSQRGAISRKFLEIRTAWEVRHWSWLKPNAGRYLALRTISLLMIIGLFMSIHKQFRNGEQHFLHRNQYAAMLEQMRPAPNQSERLLVTFGADFPYEHQAALVGNNDYSGLRFFSLGWPQRTPLAERMKKYFKIETLGQAIATRSELMLVMNSNGYCCLMDYLAEHYDKDLRIVKLKEFPLFALSIIGPRDKTAEFEQPRENSTPLAIPFLKRLGLQR